MFSVRTTSGVWLLSIEIRFFTSKELKKILSRIDSEDCLEVGTYLSFNSWNQIRQRLCWGHAAEHPIWTFHSPPQLLQNKSILTTKMYTINADWKEKKKKTLNYTCNCHARGCTSRHIRRTCTFPWRLHFRRSSPVGHPTIFRLAGSWRMSNHGMVVALV